MYNEMSLSKKFLSLVLVTLLFMGAFAFYAEAPSLGSIEVVVPEEVEFDHENETSMEIEGILWVNGSFSSVEVTLNASSELLGDNITIPESPITFSHATGNTVYMETFTLEVDYSQIEEFGDAGEDVITVYGTWEWVGLLGQATESGDLDVESINLAFLLDAPENGDEVPDDIDEEEPSRTAVYLLGGLVVIAAAAVFFLSKSRKKTEGSPGKRGKTSKGKEIVEEEGVNVEPGGSGRE